MGLELAGSRILLTGASSGIGAALAVDLGRAGATIGLVARRAALLDEVLGRARAAGAGAESRCWAVDLGDLDAAERVALEAWEAFGRIDAAVNNAAIPKRRHVTALSPDELAHVMTVNFLSPARICLTLMPPMIERGAGVLVNVGSVAGRLGNAGEAAYCASKFALSGFTETLAIDLAGTGVEVRLVTPGPFDTPIWDVPADDPGHYEGPKYPPETASKAIIDALTGADTHFEVVTPPEFQGVVEYKTANIDTYLQGSAAMVAAGKL